MYRYTELSLLAIIAATGAAAYATKGDTENDALAISKAKIPLWQAERAGMVSRMSLWSG